MNASDELLAVLTEAVAVALREMAGVEAAPRDAREASAHEGFADVSAVLTVTTSAGAGYFVLSCPEAVGTALAQRVFAETGTDPDAAMVRDCLGEVVNVIAGQAKTLLFGTPLHFTLDTPSTATGVPALASFARFVVTFTSDVGEFAVHVRLPN